MSAKIAEIARDRKSNPTVDQRGCQEFQLRGCGRNRVRIQMRDLS